jgi:Na+/proline symporter/signal transduction histidine kinase
MLETGTILFFSFGYMGLLFALAYYGDKRADLGKSIISNSYIYALSMAVYCTAWTFYGSVGRAVRTGPGFLTIYLGPTLMATLGWLVLRKIIRISKIHRITSIADFIASRYGKSTALAGLAAAIAVFGIIPYISLQLKAISTSFQLINNYPDLSLPGYMANLPFYKDTAFYVALLLAVFAILFGTRHLDATERHEGLVAAIAFESIVKLVAFLTVGLFVTYGIYNGFADIIHKAETLPQTSMLFSIGGETSNLNWSTHLDWSIHMVLSMMAIIFLPRQFQVVVVENVNEDHLGKAIWLFPLYLLVINIFVLPVALGGMLHFQDGSVDADTFVLTLPMAMQQQGLALFVYIGGMSAATGMVIVETVALSTMICNELVMPVLLRLPLTKIPYKTDLSKFLLMIRRAAIVFVLLLGYMHFHFIGGFYALVSIGLVSFAAVAQFAPAILGGIFWKDGTRLGAFWGLVAGFLVWGYTLFLPSLVPAGLVPVEFVQEGPWGISTLRPFQLFGLENFSQISHATFWSLLFNSMAYIGVSMITKPTAIEHTQATLFVDVFKYSKEPDKSKLWRATANLPDLQSLIGRFLGKERAEEVLIEYSKDHEIDWNMDFTADSGLVNYTEKLLAGSIGSASARVLVSSVVKEEPLSIKEIMDILDETRQVIEYSRELEHATNELKAANERLKELDKLKDEFISTVTHELKTPLTSVRALAEILYDNPIIPPGQQKQFSGIIIKESDRLTRLITQVLDFQKIERGQLDWEISMVNMREVIEDAVSSTSQLIKDKNLKLNLKLLDNCPEISGDRDRLIQVMVNIISNAVKFCEEGSGKITIRLNIKKEHLRVDVIDTGIGIRTEDQAIIFEKFRQVKNTRKGRPTGTGLGLTITKRIIEHHGGTIWVESEEDKGATFSFVLPVETNPFNSLYTQTAEQ